MKKSGPKKQQIFLVLPLTLCGVPLRCVDYLDSYLCIFLTHSLMHSFYTLAKLVAASYVSSCFLAIHHSGFQQPNRMPCNWI